MLRIGKTKLSRLFSAIIALFCILSWANLVLVQGQPFPEIHEKLIGISKEEKEVLENLFVLMQEIEGIEIEEGKLAQDIDKINKEIKDLEVTIVDEEKIYEKNKEGLKQVLKSYQRMGPGSYLEIILNSDNLAMLLRRINTLQDITRNTGQLLKLIESSKDKLLKVKTNLTDKLTLIEEKQEHLGEALSKKIQLKEDIEEYLASLEDEREYYQEYLSNLQQMWNQIGSTLSDAVKELSRIIAEEELPADALKLSFSLFSIKGSIEEKTFNDIVKKYSKLPDMIFSFSSEKMVLELPDNNLILKGKLVVSGENTLEFKVEEGSFYGMPLENWAIEELFQENKLVLNLKPLLEGNKLRSVEIKQGYIELTSTLQFWGGEK